MTYALQAGDCLLFSPSGFFGSIIKLKTWHNISHVEVYDGPTGPSGAPQSWASRDGVGVNLYPARLNDIAIALRPRCLKGLDLDAMRAYGKSMIGTPYGWGDLLEFVNITHDFKGIVCSPFATLLYRAGGFDPFDGEDAQKIAPFEFAVTDAFVKLPLNASV